MCKSPLQTQYPTVCEVCIYGEGQRSIYRNTILCSLTEEKNTRTVQLQSEEFVKSYRERFRDGPDQFDLRALHLSPRIIDADFNYYRCECLCFSFRNNGDDPRSSALQSTRGCHQHSPNTPDTRFPSVSFVIA